MRRLSLLLLLTCPAFVPVVAHAQNRDAWNYNNNSRWDSSWNRRPYPQSGACFFSTANYRDNRFCVRRGDRLSRLPSNFGDNISSIRLFGGARVVVFNDRNYTGGSQEFRNSVPDLRNRRFRDGHTWNNRISSVIVR
jgi:hypothetical protein